jgi:hypothetical protein
MRVRFSHRLLNDPDINYDNAELFCSQMLVHRWHTVSTVMGIWRRLLSVQLVDITVYFLYDVSTALMLREFSRLLFLIMSPVGYSY